MLQKARISLHLLGKGSVEIGSSLEPPMPLAGHDGVPAWSTRGRGDVGVVKEGSFLGNPIKGGSRYDRIVAINRGMGRPPVIGNAEENIGAFGFGRAGDY